MLLERLAVHVFDLAVKVRRVAEHRPPESSEQRCIGVAEFHQVFRQQQRRRRKSDPSTLDGQYRSQQLRVVYRRNVWHARYLQAGNIIKERHPGSSGMHDSSGNVVVVAGINERFSTVAEPFGVPRTERWNEVRSWGSMN